MDRERERERERDREIYRQRDRQIESITQKGDTERLPSVSITPKSMTYRDAAYLKKNSNIRKKISKNSSNCSNKQK